MSEASLGLDELVPGYESFAAALKVRPDIQQLLQRLGTIEDVLRRPATVERCTYLLTDVEEAIGSVLHVEDELWKQIGSDVPWRLYRWLARGAGWLQAAGVAHDYAVHSANSPAEVFDALRSAVAHIGEACFAYLRLELAVTRDEGNIPARSVSSRD